MSSTNDGILKRFGFAGLNSKNYKSWSLDVTNYLMGQSQWFQWQEETRPRSGTVTASSELATPPASRAAATASTSDPALDAVKASAASVMFATMEAEQKQQFAAYMGRPLALWKAVADHYGVKNAGTRYNAYNALTRVEATAEEEADIDLLILRVGNLYHELINLLTPGATAADVASELKIVALISALPPSYDATATRLLSSSTLQWDAVTSDIRTTALFQRSAATAAAARSTGTRGQSSAGKSVKKCEVHPWTHNHDTKECKSYPTFLKDPEKAKEAALQRRSKLRTSDAKSTATTEQVEFAGSVRRAT